MVVVQNTALKRLPEETEAQFISRLVAIKDCQKLRWSEIAHIANKELNLDYSESWYRKNYKAGMFIEDPVFETTCASTEDIETDSEDDVDLKLRQILMKRAEVADLVSSNNAMIRRMSREQTIKDIAHDYALIMKEAKPCLTLKLIANEYSGKEGVLLISDWHYGLVCDNAWNTFDPDVCKDRVSVLLSGVIEWVKKHRLAKVTVLDLADLIAGRIHSQIRIESRFDVITQTMDVAEIVAEFLDKLSIHCPVDFYSCLDNHSRVEPNKKESMDLESLARIIPWYLKERLEDNRRIKICENEFGEDIITCQVLGNKIIAVHGHEDSPVNGLDRLSMFTREHYDMLCMAHRHHMFLEEQSEAFVISNGCLAGVDTHSKKLRLSSKPSQTLIVCTKDNVTDSIHRLLLN